MGASDTNSMLDPFPLDVLIINCSLNRFSVTGDRKTSPRPSTFPEVPQCIMRVHLVFVPQRLGQEGYNQTSPFIGKLNVNDNKGNDTDDAVNLQSLYPISSQIIKQ